ncbi:orotate phosphoribosyltransferase [Ornithinibacillus gellani]|uniref:orotate phosphoribosyltransferase n=1 Tax=Ornithinibacillus gellani TaxID=2293253 RepID=UPI000F47E5A3|nr:orotate phosphoribosyltransferase [Ornithinibacillus gellani]TQS75630.1 orotate phosphoribosyltransferase [Ornithinibacillus gellani]
MEWSKDVARDLLHIQAVQINAKEYFTWTSGIQSPIYCDNRLTMSYPAIRRKITDAFVHIMEAQGAKPDVIAGCATAGIPHASWLAERLDLPMVYVRSKPKGHGKGNQIEGEVKPGQRVIVIEDLISTGGSSLESAHALQQEGANVTGVLAIFTYGLKKSKESFEAAGISLNTITGFDILLEALLEDEKLTATEKEELIAWRDAL